MFEIQQDDNYYYLVNITCEEDLVLKQSKFHLLEMPMKFVSVQMNEPSLISLFWLYCLHLTLNVNQLFKIIVRVSWQLL